MSLQRPEDGAVARRSALLDARSSDLHGLTLAQLRAYRQRLVEEEDRVSYWRRLTQARLDVLEAESHVDGTLSMRDLVRALGDTGTGRRRSALVSIRPAEPLPELPVLAEMWVTEVDPHDPAAVTDAFGRLRQAEWQLTEYRRAVHERLDEATGELVARYRADPASALAALPEA